MAGETKTYRVLSPLEHAKKQYAIGKTVDLTPEEAAPLIALKVLSAEEKTVKTKEKEKE